MRLHGGYFFSDRRRRPVDAVVGCGEARRAGNFQCRVDGRRDLGLGCFSPSTVFFFFGS